MKNQFVLGPIGFLLLVACGSEHWPTALETQPGVNRRSAEPTEGAGSLDALGGFVENGGQWSSEVLFFARHGGVEATLVERALLFRPSAAEGEALVRPLVLHLPGKPASVRGIEEQATRRSFFLGARSASDVSGYARVRYEDLQPGIDLEVRMSGSAFEYDLLLDPGADLAGFVIETEGAERLELAAPDLLRIHTEAGPIDQRIEVSWQLD